MPASQREQFIADLQHKAAEDEDVFGRVAERFTTMFNADDRARRLSEQAIAASTTDSTKYVPGVTGSPGNPMAINHEQLKNWSTQDNEPSTAGDISAEYDGLKTGYEGMNESVTAAVKTLRGAWEGDGADAATSFGDQLAQYTKSNSSNARLAAEVTNQQSEASSLYRNAMPEPIPFSWQQELAEAKSAPPWEANAIIGDAFDKQARSQAAHEQAAQVTTDFEKSTFASASKTPVFSEPPKFDLGGGGGDDPGPRNPGTGSIGGTTPRIGGGSTTPSGGSTGGGSTASHGIGGTGGNGGLPPGAVRLPDGSIRYPDGTIVKPDGTKILPDGTKILPDGTRILPNGKVIPPGNTSSSGLSTSGTGGPNSGGAGGFGPGAGGAGAGAGGGAAGGFGPGGGGAGAMAGPGAGGLGAGKGSGVGGSGPGGAGGRGGMGAGMGRGMGGGMMGGGGGAGRGGGDDEKEHKDQYYVKQEMDPGLQIEHDEYGERLIDESTGMTVVPPVIGE